MPSPASSRREGPPAQATIEDVARQAGVSTATVSRILSGASTSRPATRERVLAAVETLGYRPSHVARSLKLRRTQTIGVIITDVVNPYFGEMVRAVEDATRRLDYSVLLCNGAEDPEREAAYLEVLATRRVDGIIVATSGVGQRHATWLARAPVPVVMMNCEAPVEGVPAIVSDNRAGGRLAAEHLISLGHRRIGHITAPPANAAGVQRLAGIRDAFAAHGMSAQDLSVVVGDGHAQGGERAIAELLGRSPDVTGVVFYNDLSAIGALRTLRALGIAVPRDMSVVGFDNLDLAAYADPPLTTIAQDTVAMGNWAVDRLMRLMSDERRLSETRDEPSEVVRLPVRLLVRESTTRWPAQVDSADGRA